MDGHFVPNITIGPSVVAALRKHAKIPFDVHLMIAPVDPFVGEFVKAGANIVTVHPESGPHLHRTLGLIKAEGAKAGVSLNPATPLSVIEPVLGEIDLILVMTVNPGFGGQAFIESGLEKIRALRRMIDASKRPIELEVDGGINFETAPRVIQAGASVLVAGTATFAGGAKAYADNIARLRAAR
jgi:ribulose-phosphate 3-epimerase